VSAPLRLGLVGCGRLAEAGYLPAIAGLPGVELAAVADPASERRGRIAQLSGTEPAQFESAEALAAAGVVDAAVIATPVASHLADTAALTAEGVPCLVEKPPAVGVEGAEALADLTPAPWVGFNRRFTHGARLLDAVPADGELELDLELRYRRASWRAVEVGDPAILDLGAHLVDLALLLTGSDHARVRVAGCEHERAALEIETGRGIARISCATDLPHRERIVVRSGGRTVASSREGGPIAALTTRLPWREPPLVASLRAQLEAFARVVAGGDGGLLATAADGVATMRVIEAAA
jgi:predicted dehydrogenase